MNPPIYTNENENHVLKIFHDIDPTSPRDWDHLGTMFCWHGKYNLGDKHNFQTPDQFVEHTNPEDNGILLPIYLYDHSGITIKTTPFSCPWDSGQVGYIYVDNQDVEKEYGELNQETIEKAKKILENEVETYDQYLRGDIYGFTLEKKDNCEHCDHTELETEDSCWGFYGQEHIKEELESQNEEMKELVADFV